jgi:hypothetical protein
MINNVLDLGLLPRSSQTSAEPLYLAFTGPTIGSSTYPTAGGYHDSTTGHKSNELVYGWVGDFGGLDATMPILGHETAEAMTDPRPGSGITAQSGSSFPHGGNGEVGDWEAQNDVYRLNGGSGPLVQSLWSKANNAFVVADGTKQALNVNPEYVNGLFVGDQLSVRGRNRWRKFTF